ncbi:hypothetical protein M413DRAFT_284467 [Hebeloma cylindrosporum]|uniref:Uncharacterized protein n=1 Tax=Hebeloma cylindrosporum TaxID=76867 RepID=A0A0C3BZB3_HEBCY|nr:hypothetical protein M413DRAFT_284467 [Hebeloma cylindrosporum h7]
MEEPTQPLWGQVTSDYGHPYWSGFGTTIGEQQVQTSNLKAEENPGRPHVDFPDTKLETDISISDKHQREGPNRPLKVDGG